MDDEMIERVAKAIADADDKEMTDAKIGWDKCDASMKEDYRKEAKSAIKAMLEPTEKMLEAARKQVFIEDSPSSIFISMIDAVIGD